MICVNVQCKTEFTNGNPDEEYGLLFCRRCREKARRRFERSGDHVRDAMDCGTMNDMLVETLKRRDGTNDNGSPVCGWINLEAVW